MVFEEQASVKIGGLQWCCVSYSLILSQNLNISNHCSSVLVLESRDKSRTDVLMLARSSNGDPGLQLAEQRISFKLSSLHSPSLHP